MTHDEQIMISNEMYDVHIAMDTAANLLQDVIYGHFTEITAHKDFEFNYGNIQSRLTAVSEFLYQACLKMDFVTGEETPLTEAYKRNSAELIAYHSISKVN